MIRTSSRVSEGKNQFYKLQRGVAQERFRSSVSEFDLINSGRSEEFAGIQQSLLLGRYPVLYPQKPFF